MSELTKHATNEQLVGHFPDLSKPTVFAVEDSRNPEYKVLYIAQQVTAGTDRESITKVQQILLGWKPSIRIARCVQTISVTIFNELNIQPGYQFTEFSVETKERTEPAYVGQEPVKDGKGNVLLSNGMLVYEHSQLVYGTSTNIRMEKKPVPETKKDTKASEVTVSPEDIKPAPEPAPEIVKEETPVKEQSKPFSLLD